MIYCLIPARGGSKRIPRKNIIDFCGKPLICHTIEKCLNITPEVWVSSDDDEILSIAQACGSFILKRPVKISGDKSTSHETIEHFKKYVLNGSSDDILLSQVTSPLVDLKYFREGIEKYNQGIYDTVISTCEGKGIYWTQDGKPINHVLNSRLRSQDMPKWYKENGAFYIFSGKQDGIFGKRVGFVEVPKMMSVDIDTYEDLELAKCIWKIKYEKDKYL